MKEYCTKKCLNPEASASTGSIVCFAGPTSYSPEGTFFIEIADCHGKICLHQTSMDTVSDFINKARLIVSETQAFIDFITELSKPDTHLDAVKPPFRKGYVSEAYLYAVIDHTLDVFSEDDSAKDFADYIRACINADMIEEGKNAELSDAE